MAKKEIPYGFIEEDKIYLSAWGEFTDKCIGEIKDDDEETSILYFQNRFQLLKDKVSEIESEIQSAENKGSYLMKLKHLHSSLNEHDGLGNYEEVEKKLSQLITYIEDIIQSNRQKNTEIKNALLDEIQEVKEIVNWREATEKVLDIKNRWIKTGAPLKEKEEELEESFWGTVNEFYEKKKEFYEDKKKLTGFYQKKYEELVSEAELLIKLEPDVRKNKEEQLIQQWKDNGAVPAEIYRPLHQKFNRALKARHNTNTINISELIKKFNSFAENELPGIKDLKNWQESLKKFRPNSKEERDQKTQAFILLNTLQEKSFIENLCRKKRRNFDELSVQDQKKIKKAIIRDLLERDRQELKTIELNFEKFSSQNESVNKMMERKIVQQKQKISIKESILSELNK